MLLQGGIKGSLNIRYVWQTIRGLLAYIQVILQPGEVGAYEINSLMTSFIVLVI